ncbi:transposase, partial [Xanthomonas oryzae pv. oryzae]
DQVFIVNMTAYILVRMRTLGQMYLQAGERA